MKVNASLHESRREVLTLVGLSLTLPAFAENNPIEVFDNRTGAETVRRLDEARELGLSQDIRDGLKQARDNIEGTKARLAESTKRINDLSSRIDKKYWTDLKAELRNQVGSLRFDLNTLTAGKPKEVKKEAEKLKKDLYAKIDKLDYAASQKSQENARKAFADVQDALNKVSATLS